MNGDTIAAISTPLGEGGIGIVRLSGPQSAEILSRIFLPRKARCHVVPWRLTYGHVVDPEDGRAIDEVLAVHMPAPNTYTREDVVEINCHGGYAPLQAILSLALRHGARLAHPGEFTLRAFINGRIDLAQAESVLDVIQARTQIGLRVAVDQLGGRLSKEVSRVRGVVISALAYLTATIDFSDDEIPEQDVQGPLAEAIAGVEQLLNSADAGIIYRQGLRTAIVGRPNVGKSSILNALLRENRAIVTPVPGTTRDTLEEVINVKGLPVVLVDTAGIAATDDLVERLGVERSRGAMERADLVLWVVDGSSPLTDHDREIALDLCAKPVIVVVNKCDLDTVVGEEHLRELVPGSSLVRTSALTGEGLHQLEEKITETVFAGRASASDALLVSNPRHKDALARALDHLRAAIGGVVGGMPADFVTIDLTAAASALGEITGETVSEDLLETIFSKFCVGK